MARKNETTNGDLRTPVSFYTSQTQDGLDGRDIHYEKTFFTFGEVYNPSLKDMEIASGHGVKATLTVKIRDPLKGYMPKNTHFVEIYDSRLNGTKWPIVDIRPDFQERDFLVIVLGGDING